MLPAPAWNQTEVDFPRDKTISQVFEEQAMRTPDAIALICGPRQFSYRELGARADRLAVRLQEAGVRPETLVGIGIERSLELVIALLGTLKAGGAYVPIDLSQPQHRIHQILRDADPAVLLTSDRSRSKLPASAPVVTCEEPERETFHSSPAGAVGTAARSENLAYVLYTSGSTGKPKGVMVEHRNVINFFTAMDRVIGRTSGVWLALTGVAFDISVLEVLWTLTRGFTVVLHGDEGMHTVADEMERYRVTHLQSTPSLMRLMLLDANIARGLGTLQKIVIGGETLPSSLAAQVRGLTSAQIFNAYGPTETTIWSTMYSIENSTPNVPIGRPIANTRTYILGNKLTPVPVGEVGVLYIGGAGVARGYLHQPDLTRARFITGDTVAGGRIYNTGDLARYLPDGNIEYLGRTDFQVKIRGFRVETGELETNLELHPSVQQAIVVAREDQFGDEQLVAYIVRKTPVTNPVTGVELRSTLRERLPEYMMPSRFVFLDRMPLTPNGKMDRSALPAPSASARDENTAPISAEDRSSGIQRVIGAVDPETIGPKQGVEAFRRIASAEARRRFDVRPFELPQVAARQQVIRSAPNAAFTGHAASSPDELRLQLVGVWEDLLGVKPVRLNDNFFDLGGHSLLAARLAARLRKIWGAELPLSMLFEAPTIEELATLLQGTIALKGSPRVAAIQPQGSRPAFLCVDAGPYFRLLAKRLNPGQPFLGLRLADTSGLPVHFAMSDIAAYHIETIRGIQPQGPYYLGGWSASGLVAYEISRQLVAQGEQVALLVLFDVLNSAPPTSSTRWESSVEICKFFAWKIKFHVARLMETRRKDLGAEFRYLFRRIRLDLSRAFWVVGDRLQRLLSRPLSVAPREASKAVFVAAREYRPVPYDGNVVLFRSAVQSEGPYKDPKLGWGQLVNGSLQIREMPGDHEDMFREPHVELLAKELSRVLDEAAAASRDLVRRMEGGMSKT